MSIMPGIGTVASPTCPPSDFLGHGPSVATY